MTHFVNQYKCILDEVVVHKRCTTMTEMIHNVASYQLYLDDVFTLQADVSFMVFPQFNY